MTRYELQLRDWKEKGITLIFKVVVTRDWNGLLTYVYDRIGKSCSRKTGAWLAQSS